jgi:hypothetical protein
MLLLLLRILNSLSLHIADSDDDSESLALFGSSRFETTASRTDDKARNIRL